MAITVHPYGDVLGARVEGLDFEIGVSEADIEAIARALYRHQVIAISAGDMTAQQHLDIALHFGEPEHNATEYFQRIEGVPHITVVDSDAGDRADSWHADETFLEHPPLVNFLHARQLPECGGDTAFISAAAAYEALSDKMKTMLEGLTAQHDLAMTYEQGWRYGLPLMEKVGEMLTSGKGFSHPVVKTHPETGRQWLTVNPTYTRFVEGLPPLEAQMLLDFLCRHMQKPEFGYRHQWRVGDLVIWDQRAVQHYAVRNFTGRRVIHRISVLPRGAEAKSAAGGAS